jgi:hypothetical protein
VPECSAMDLLSSRALAAALAVTETHGLRCAEPVVLKDRANLMVHLQPAPVVARMATTTALVRPAAAEFLARDLAVATFLVSRGAPVVPPSREILAGPHSWDGFAMTFLEFVPHDPNYQATSPEVGAMLKQLHAVLKIYPGELPNLNPVVGEIPHFLAYLERAGELDPSDLALLRSSSQRTTLALRDPIGPVQALHGDAHKSNLLKTARGLLWTDFEDTCSGAVAWDTAVFPERRLRVCKRRWQITNWPRVLRSRSHTWKQEICKACSGLRWLRARSIRIASRRGRGCRVGRSRPPSSFEELKVAIASPAEVEPAVRAAPITRRRPALRILLWLLAARSSPCSQLLPDWALPSGKPSQIGEASRRFPRSSTGQVPLPLRACQARLDVRTAAPVAPRLDLQLARGMQPDKAQPLLSVS